jgi:hypothetical protein
MIPSQTKLLAENWGEPDFGTFRVVFSIPFLYSNLLQDEVRLLHRPSESSCPASLVANKQSLVPMTLQEKVGDRNLTMRCSLRVVWYVSNLPNIDLSGHSSLYMCKGIPSRSEMDA